MVIERKSYEQVCPVATALDYVGDRWTILIMRELLGGSARFNELRDGLPGIASNLLAERLRRLEEDGLVRQRKVHNASVYVLTAQGAAIRVALEELGMWGARLERVAAAKYERSTRAFAMALQSILVRAGDALPTERLVIELDVEGDLVEIILDQQPTVTVRPSREPDVYAQISNSDMSSLLAGQPVDTTIFTDVSGDETAIKLLLTALK